MVEDASILADLRAELGILLQRRQARELDGRGLGLGGCNVANDLDIEAEVRREEFAAERARIVELEVEIRRLEAELPNSPAQLNRIWAQVEARHRRGSA